jgi:hypothetical protein
VQHLVISTRYTEVRCAGSVIASVLVEPGALDALVGRGGAAALLDDAPAPAHLLVELCDGAVRWRRLDGPPQIDRPWERTMR